MDERQRDEILWRLDERTKRVDDHLERLDRRVAEAENELDEHDNRIQVNEEQLSLIAKAGGGTLAFLTTTISAIAAKLAGIIKI